MHRSVVLPRQTPWAYTLVMAALLTVFLAACSGPNPVADTSAPTVVETTPSDGATAPTNEPVSATFDEAIDDSTLTTSSFVLVGPGATVVAGTVSYDEATQTAVHTPTVALDADTAYTATLSTDVTDVAGNALDASVSWSFTTAVADTSAPTVVETTPSDGATAPT
ncbi:MAG: Ig-like domain-containing protein, partial [Trueperaceae bacterium]